MATPYDAYTSFGSTEAPGGSGFLTPGSFGIDYGAGPASSAATTTAVDMVGKATGPWGMDTGLNPAGSSWQQTSPGVTGGGGGGSSKSGFGWNLGTLDVAIGGLKTLAGIWQAWEQNKIAKEQLAMQRGLTNANLTNQVMAYNTHAEDIMTNRVESGGWTPQRGSNWLASHKLANVQV